VQGFLFETLGSKKRQNEASPAHFHSLEASTRALLEITKQFQKLSSRKPLSMLLHDILLQLRIPPLLAVLVVVH
jgi:hypothetical protein